MTVETSSKEPKLPRGSHSAKLVAMFLALATVLISVIWFGFPVAKRMCLKAVGDVLLEGFGPGASDYAIPLVSDFELCRTSSKTRFIHGPNRETGPNSSSHIWVDFDVRELGCNETYIVCHQEGIDHESSTEPGWWIIDTLKLERYGPLDKQGYKTQLTELGATKPIPIYDTPKSSGDVRRFKKKMKAGRNEGVTH